MMYKTVIGLEIHAELLTKTKMFCRCKNSFGGEKNTRICPVCAGFPGALPSLNKDAVILGIIAGAALDCRINNLSSFDRKNYFYPDLPKAYQITQFYRPLCSDGSVILDNGKKIGIERIHLEEDAGKLIHNSRLSRSDIDLNRCGVPLIEIVTRPDMSSADEVCEFVKKAALRLKYAGVCDAKLEEGSLRVDVNISLCENNSITPGTRAEIKNINSIRSISRAIAFEQQRMADILSGGGKVLCETRRFDENLGKTFSMRPKETASEYRYFPEPDIPPLYISDDEISKITTSMPVMPDKLFEKYTKEYKIPKDAAQLVISKKDLSDFFAGCISLYPSYITVLNLITGELSRLLNKSGKPLSALPISPKTFSALAKMYDEKKITARSAKDILDIMAENGGSPLDIANEKGYISAFDPEKIKELCALVISENKAAVSEYLGGEKKVFGFLMGKLIRLSGKNTDPALCKTVLENMLQKEIGQNIQSDN